jgi:hypothetical protein
VAKRVGDLEADPLGMEVRPPAHRACRLPRPRLCAPPPAQLIADCGVSLNVVPKLLQLASTDRVTDTVPRCKSRVSMYIDLLGFKCVI